MSRAKARAEWTVERIDGAARDYLGRWDAANREFNGGTPVLSSRFIAPLCDRFATRPLFVAELQESNTTRVIMIIEPSRRGLWQTFSPGQACVAPLMVAPDYQGSFSGQLVELMGSLPGWPWLLRLHKLDPDLAQGLEFTDSGLFTKAKYGTTTAVVTSDPFAEFWRKCGKSVRQHVSRTKRRLEEAATPWSLRVVDASQDMPLAVAEHGRLESTGWKGREGTAIRPDSDQGRFYTDVMQQCAREDRARVYQLLVAEAVVASLLTIRDGGLLVVLKTAYDEQFKKLAPGRFLDYLMLKASFEDPSIRRIENYTTATSADLKWTTESRDLYSVDMYRWSLLASMASVAAPIRRSIRG